MACFVVREVPFFLAGHKTSITIYKQVMTFKKDRNFGLNIFIHNSVKIHTHKKVQHNERI